MCTSSRQLIVVALALVLSACGAAGSAPAGPANASRPSSPSDATELVRRGRAAADQGDSVRAEQYLALAIERGADPSVVLPTLLQVCLSSSRLRAALGHAEPYLRDNPEDDALRYLVATIHLGLGQEAEARSELELLRERSAAGAPAHYLLGIIDARRDPVAARDHFRAYLELTPKGRHAAEVRSRLSEILVRENLAARAGEQARAELRLGVRPVEPLAATPAMETPQPEREPAVAEGETP
jgi:tetratricopeptide (TPR) repeat protein